MLKPKLIILIGSVLLAFCVYSVVSAAPVSQLFRSIVPVSDNTYYIGTTTPSNLRYNGVFNNLTVSGTCTGCGTGAPFAWTVQSWGVSTSTTLGFLNGFLSTASSTFTGGFLANAGTTTNATSTSFAISSIASSLLKTNASGSVIPAISGTDYEAALTKGNLTASSPLSLSATRQVIGGAAALSWDFSIGNTWTGAQIFDTITRSTTTSATTTSLFSTTASSTNLFASAFDFGSSILSLVANTITAGARAILDFGAAIGLEIPNSSSPTMGPAGRIALDTTSNNLIVATTTTGHFVAASATTTLYGLSVASTSPDFINGGVIELPAHHLAQVATAIICKVDAGTSVVINLSNEAGTSDTNIITCTATSNQYALTSNSSYAAYAVSRLEVGAITGAVDYLTIRVVGYRTSD